MVIWEMLFRTALRTIKNNYGQVCDKYASYNDGCEHESCRSSRNAWAVADQALEMYEHRGEVEGGEDGEHQEAGETGC